MEYVFYGLLAVAFIAFVVLVIRSYRKKLASGCCGASDESVKKNKVADKDKSHYPYEKTLVVDGMVCKNCSSIQLTVCGRKPMFLPAELRSE